MRSKSYYSFGTSLHSVLQRFHDSEDRGVTTTEEAVAALEESWVTAGYASQEEMIQAQSEGKAMIEAYVEAWAKEPVTARTIAVEKQLRLDMGDWVLLGRIDRLDEREDGTIEIVDYKSGRREVSVEEVQTDIAMGCYQLIVRGHYPDREVVASIVALRTGARATASMTPEEREVFAADLQLLANEILNLDPETVEPTPKELCRTCDFLALCSRHAGFELPQTE